MDETDATMDYDEKEDQEREEELTKKQKTTTSYGFSIDSSRIRAVPVEEQSSVLRNLGIDVFDQEEFEQGVLKQVDEAIAAKELEADIKRWEKDLKSVNEEIRMTLAEIDQIERILKGLETSITSSYESRRREEAARRQLDNKMKQLKKLQASQKSLNHKLGISDDNKEIEDIEDPSEKQDTQQNILQDRLQIMKELQKEREQLIGTGEMTPFGSSIDKASTSRHSEDEATTFDRDIFTDDADDNDETPSVNQSDHERDSDEYIPDDDELKDSWYDGDTRKTKGVRSKSSNVHKGQQERPNVIYTGEDAIQAKPKKYREYFRDTQHDDGDDNFYKNRIREEKIKKLLKEQASERNPDAEEHSDEETPDMEFDNRMKIPGHIWHKLYLYQQTGVKWLWELHSQHAGGIIGDEMGLGKTIQAIAFLAGLKYSKIGTKKSRNCLGPILIVSPVTVLHQWVAEFHKWAPEFRVAVLHDTGSYQGHKDTLIRKICHANGVLVTSYSGVRMNIDNLLNKHWDYVILDEGHKIRNPDAEITLACKQFRTPHRIILTGTPMQNNLRELWSLFDFVFPGKLGTLPVFMTEFSVPITTGGYANASTIQVQTAYKCACVLRDTINPYLLRRLKKDVKMSLELPDKNEQVLFCRLSEEQRELYQEYLDSREVQAILAGNYKVFPGLIMLRKICNHPDLTSEAGSLVKAKQDKLRAEKGLLQGPADEDDGYGDWRRAGKMVVVEALLKMWKAQGHRVLLFSQSRQMLNIMEKFVVSRRYSYRRMDGSTSISTRQPLVNKFNTDTSIFVFLLTTRVGGLGVNLTGADRVIIYDPDWNPSTDTQARERSWRIGQSNKVTIYRLLTSGTIEEKIYHRQIFKQFLTNRVLKDPKQRRFFKSNDLYELFTLDESYKKQGTETSAIFAGTNCEVKVKNPKKRKADPRETAQPVKKSRTVVKPKKPKTIKRKPVDDRGGFSIDARDILEINRAKEADQEKTKTVKKVSFSEDIKEASCANTEESTTDDVKELEKSNDDVTSIENSDVTPKDESSHDVTRQANSNGNGTSRINSYKDVTSREKSSNDVTSGDKSAIDVTDDGGNVHISSSNDDVNLGAHSKNGDKSNGVTNTNLSEEAKPSVNLNDEKNVKEFMETIDVDSKPSAGVDDKLSSKEGRKKKKKLKASTLSDREIRRLTRIKKNRRKKRKKGKIEGHEIDNLDYHEIYHTESSTDTADRPAANHNEDAILTALFKKGGVHSALKHDVIMDSGNPDYSLVESEANRVAQQAVHALKKSRQQCLGARSGVPTWTGVSGLSGHSSVAKPKPRFGKKANKTTQEKPKSTKKGKEPALFSGAFMGMQTNEEDSAPVSSSQLLAKMRARNNVLPEETDTSASVLETEHDSLLAEISQFVTSGGSVPGQASTQEILERFSSMLPRENTAVFRALLRRICDFKRDSKREGVWRLKSDFL